MQINGNRPSVLFMSGDMSGDIYMARLTDRLASLQPDMELHAVGGGALGTTIERAGGTWIGDSTGYSRIGLHSALPHFFKGKAGQGVFRRYVRSQKIDLAVLCDWGAANCRQLRFLKKRGIPTLYYFPPGSWRREGDPGRDIVRYATKVATPFPWSAERFARKGCLAEWVGHPVLETSPSRKTKEDLRKEFGAKGDCPLVALLPGSRISEIRTLAPRLASAAGIIAGRIQVRFVVPVPETLVDVVRPYFPEDILCVVNRMQDVLTACDAAVVKTGTSTLEAVVSGTPQVAVYDFGWIGRFEWLFLWMWKKIPFIAMPNIILQRKVVSELLGLACTPEAIASAVFSLLEDPKKSEKMMSDYREIRKILGEELPSGATEHTVCIILEMLEARCVKRSL
ncbi:MAG: hypothetical protein K8R38_08410 [Verrucomicrobia bacterium]|nr:hypothetical protein [Verrucomicrobiota bacterium]